MPLNYNSNFVTTRVRFQTASGYAADATITNNASAYTVQLSGVPSTGETATAYVTCDNPNNLDPTWGCQFKIKPGLTSQEEWMGWHW